MSLQDLKNLVGTPISDIYIESGKLRMCVGHKTFQFRDEPSVEFDSEVIVDEIVEVEKELTNVNDIRSWLTGSVQEVSYTAGACILKYARYSIRVANNTFTLITEEKKEVFRVGG